MTSRTSLSNTSLGIDCLHNHLETALESQQRDLHIGELLELSRDCQVSCAAAMHTLNDLLLFDKIENNMLQLEKKETNCGEFLEDCIHPFVRQVWYTVVGKYITLMTRIIDRYRPLALSL